MFVFLKTKYNGVMVFDPTDPDIDKTKFGRKGWSSTSYGECCEELPPCDPNLVEQDLSCKPLLIPIMLVTVLPKDLDLAL